jgi:glycosyltransferase involved in cell wall biosynthesis
LIVHHDEGKRQLVEYWGICADRIDVIPHGIMPLNSISTRFEARKELDLPLDRLIILFFGSIRENKGLDVLLRALERVRQCKPETLLVVAGALYRELSFDKYAEIIKQANLSGNVRTFLRFIDENEVDLFFAASDIVVLPYIRFESQSGVLLRAYAHKLPVVVTNVGAMGESVSKDKVGLVVKPGSIEELADAVINALSEPDKLRSNYTKELHEKYCWDRIARLTMNSYEKALRDRS